MHRTWPSVVIVVIGCGSSSGPARPPAGNTAGGAATDAAIADAVDDDADCTLERAAIVGKLRHGSAGVKSVAGPVYADRHITESIELADGTVVSFRLGGCAHYAWELRYTVPATAIGADPERRLDAAEALLRRTPIEDNLAVDMADRIKRRARTAPRPADGPWSIDCGDANCAVGATIDGSDLHIQVGYDFPL